MDSFKGRLKAYEACKHVANGLSRVYPDMEIVMAPMADGGEGTAEALMTACKGIWVDAMVTGPLPGMRVESGYVWFDQEKTVLVEMAHASGLPLLEPAQQNPMKTTTYGTGELIRLAIEQDIEKLMLTVGGSATVDGGTGAAMALGWQFLDQQGVRLGFGGEMLERIARVVPPRNDFPLSLEVLCDVDNPLCGPNGAARVYSPQKGATPEMTVMLERGLVHLADIIASELGQDVSSLPGGGAAGGLAAGAVAFMNGRLVPGIEAVMQACGFARLLKGADWVITGEGRFDHQSLHGKVVDGVARAAKQAGARVAVLAGCVELNEPGLWPAAVKTVRATQPAGMPLKQAVTEGDVLLEKAAEQLAREEMKL